MKTTTMRRWSLYIVAFGLLLLSAFGLLISCSDVPDREKFPGGHGRTTDVANSETQKAVMGGFDPLNTRLPSAPGAGAGAGGGQPAAGGPAPKPEESIKGVVKLGGKVPPRDSYFFSIAARSPEGGPPLAVIRHQGARFPYEFTLSKANAMMQDTAFEGDIEVTARLDQDGDPITRQKGDFFGTVKTKVGDQSVTITIDQEVEAQ